MSFFEHYFSDTIFDREETMVCCPFPHKTVGGLDYFESNPSAGVNLDKGVFHCLSCNRAHSEVGFIAAILDCSYETASRLKSVFDTNDTLTMWKELGTLPEDVKKEINKLGISDKVIKELDIKSEDAVAISFPVAMYDAIVDVRNYKPDHTPKIRSRRHAISGLILPYNELINSDKSKWVLLCAGEKDMAVARSHGFNAITITGGELTLPIFKAPFKGRKVAIVYDNDAPGKEGARKIAAFLKPVVDEVRVVEGFHEICAIDKEDITDFFMKYNGTRQMLIDYIKKAPSFSDEECEKELEKTVPTMSLMEAATPKHINKTVRANIQVVATHESSFVIPTAIEAVKTASNKENDTMKEGAKKQWFLDDSTAKDILHLMDNNFKEETIFSNIKSTLLKIPSKETGVQIKKLSKEVVFRCTVTDLFETSTDNTSSIEYNAYVVGKKLDSGKKYRATFRLVPHPYDGQKLIMIILNVEEANDSVTNFKVTADVIEHLNMVRNIPGSLSEKIDILTNMTRGLTKFNTDATLIQAIDFAYNTVLEFNFKNFKHVRGFLDTIIVTESRVGKSTTAEALQKTYGLGVFTSLAGSSATVAGIIGGSNKVGGSFQTRAGLIPQNHKGLIVFEELAKCNSMILKELTDVKSSGRARITRVNGSLDLPAAVRMISLTNPRATSSGVSRPITSYPNGIEILTDLIGTAEDIARFDLMLVQAFRGGSMSNDWELPKSLPTEVYRTRVRWIWSRKAEHIKFVDDTESYIVEQCNHLNEEYDSHIKIFGTEAWKKVSRLAIAIAGITVSTENYEDILVTKEHVDYAVNFFKNIYDNDTFRLKEYVEMERRYEEEDQDGVDALQHMYLTFPALLLQLENTSNATRAELMAATGLNQDQFSTQLNMLIQQSCIRFQGQMIVPTLRFRKCMRKINRRATIKKIGGSKHGPTL